MSLSSLLGVIFGLLLIGSAILTATGNPAIYLDLPALLIVGVGVIDDLREVSAPAKVAGIVLSERKSVV